MGISEIAFTSVRLGKIHTPFYFTVYNIHILFALGIEITFISTLANLVPGK
jgi:hypothetical protein